MRSHYLFRLLGIFICFFVFENCSYGQDEKFKALFIYNFINYIDWPNLNGNNFKIIVLGNNTLASELTGFTSQKKIGQLSISVVPVKSSAEITDCQIVFISHGNNDELAKLVDKSKRNHILIITETPNSCAVGACLNFISKNGSIKFEISKSNIESSGLKVNSGLFNLGILVN